MRDSSLFAQKVWPRYPGAAVESADWCRVTLHRQVRERLVQRAAPSLCCLWQTREMSVIPRSASRFLRRISSGLHLQWLVRSSWCFRSDTTLLLLLQFRIMSLMPTRVCFSALAAGSWNIQVTLDDVARDGMRKGLSCLAQADGADYGVVAAAFKIGDLVSTHGVGWWR